jgi:hypothetical protein
MENYSKNFTLLICGQILSRVKDENYSDLISWLKNSRKNFAEIIISTWENEVNTEIETLIDRLVINKDPGPDRSIRDQKYNNKSRHFIQAISGINASNSKYIFRARIEFYKMTQDIISLPNIRILNKILEENQIKLICPAPGTLSAQKNGCPFFLSDTLIIAKKLNLVTWYESMFNDFNLYKNSWDKDHKFVEAFAIEQILGLALVQDFSKEKVEKKEANKLNKIYIPKKLYRKIEKYFPKHILLFNPNILGINGGRFLNMHAEYNNKPNYMSMRFKPYLIFRILGVKYIIRKKLSNFFRKFFPYNGENSLRSIFLRRLH